METVNKNYSNLQRKGLIHAIIVSLLLMYVTILPILMVPEGGNLTKILFVSPAIGLLLVVLLLLKFNIIRLVLVVCLTILSSLMVFLSVYSSVVRTISEERFAINFLLFSGTLAAVGSLLLLIYSKPLQYYLYSNRKAS